ncbi:hypothetical protein QTP88_004137 [Uroleucon formosanum]
MYDRYGHKRGGVFRRRCNASQSGKTVVRLRTRVFHYSGVPTENAARRHTAFSVGKLGARNPSGNAELLGPRSFSAGSRRVELTLFSTSRGRAPKRCTLSLIEKIHRVRGV